MTNNLFTSIPDDLPNELFETFASSDTVKIERIVSRGHITPEGEWYDQEWHEWVVLLEGKARLALADQDAELLLSKGDYVLIPAHQKHRVVFTSKDEDTIWLAIHFKGEITS